MNSQLMNVINIREIAVFGIKRSGNHAIIHWLLHHMGKKTVHLNDVTGANPYDSCTEINAKGLPLYRSKLRIRDLYRRFVRNDVIEYSKQDRSVQWDELRMFSPKDCLILSYENLFIENDAYKEFQKKPDSYVGRSVKRYRVVVLRDAFNLFASQHRASFMAPEEIKRCVEIYKQYAEIFLKPGKQEECNIICINYNQWFLDPNYRIQLGRRFGVNITADEFQKVPSIGGGSSFDGTSMNGKAERMRVLERWKECQEDPGYRAIFKDIRLVELSDAIFGRIVPLQW